MRKHLFLLLQAIGLVTGTFAQSDTTYNYYSKSYQPTTADSAFVVLKMYPKNDGWFGSEYYKKNNALKSEGRYFQNDPKTPDGSFKNYKENGTLDYEANWLAGNLSSKTWLYKDGSKKSWISYKDGRVEKQAGWDETGKEIKNFVVEREARFKGGMDGWRKYLEKHLKASVAADAGAPAGEYPVKVQFVISKEGYVSNVKAVSVPATCKPCGSEAVSVISTGPTWEPAVQNNEPVIYQAIQYVTFVVVDDSKTKKSK